MIWQAIDENGNTCEPFLCEGRMNQRVYLEILKTKLIPFIKKHHKLEYVLFWSDLATCHYAKSVTEFLDEEKINFLQKTQNPPNVPQTRGIEKFWTLCKQRYSARQFPAKSVLGFMQIWRNISAEVGKLHGKKVMDHAFTFLREIGHKGYRLALCDLSNKNKF